MTSERDADTAATGGTPQRPQRASLTDPKTRKRFLDLIRKGHSISDAATAMGIPRPTVYDLRKRDPEFAATLKATADEAKEARKVVREAKRSAERASSPMWNYKRIAEETGLSVDTLRFYNSVSNMPSPDEASGSSPLWLPETITNWMANRPGKGFRSDLKDHDAG
ncbi:helix-turn-helix domain-containing protein [Streptomyces goshikiensis]|uniref:helix-turn-helix domain-containing protein n=1 Tax=Streptomyces goshikiensis TaxID=1942 RepID=UPI00365BDD0B